MKVTGINSAENKPYDLVKIFLFGDKCPVKEIKCYVLPGIMKYSLDVKAYDSFMSDCKDLDNFSDPLRAVTDHGEGLGVILGPGAIGDISADNPSYHKSHLIDHTYFGPAVSGRLPKSVAQTVSYRADLDYTFFKDTIADERFFYDDASIEAKLQLLEDLEFLRDKELLGVKAQEMHHNDAICLQKFKKELSYNAAKKQYTVALPFNNNKHLLPSNEWIAMKRTRILQRAFMRDRNYGLQYLAQINQLLNSDFIEEVLHDSEIGDIFHYLPHRGVVKEGNLTTSLRIVMDASARANASSLCLNDVLYTGPNLIISIAYLLLNFRQKKYGVVGDIEKAFLQLLIRPMDRDALRFFFPSNIFEPSSPMKIYRYKVVMFGASCSPFLLAAVIEHHLENHVYDTVLRNSLKNIFIDNLLATFDSEIELVKFYYKARIVFAQMGLNLRQWSSNSKLLVKAAKADGVHDDSKKVKVLGHFWDPELDEFSFNTNLKIRPKYSKRAVVSTGNQVIDTFGLLLPIEMRYRVFVQKLWKGNFPWDKIFKEKPLVNEWDLIKTDLQQALTVTFPRTIETLENIELHIFSDASFEAYGAVAYFVIPACKTYPQGITQIRFSKGKVVSPKRCPVKDTIPKLELMGVVMAANMAANLLKAYKNVKFAKKVLWSDSKTVLGQLSQSFNKVNFVQNRVIDIKNLCPGFEVRYVNTEENPADLITKSIKIKDFLTSDLWWKGPKWLPHKKDWKNLQDEFSLHRRGAQKLEEKWDEPPKVEDEIITAYGSISCFKIAAQVIDDPPVNSQTNNSPVNSQTNNSPVNSQTNNSIAQNLDPLSKFCWWKNFQDYQSLVRSYSGLLILQNARKNKSKVEKFPITQNHRAAGERQAIKLMQKECFPDELLALQKGERVRNPRMLQLKLYLDTYGIIRIRGRLNDEHFSGTNRPILFGYRHPLTILFILDQHKCYNCSSITYTLNKIRREIHSFKLRRQIREILHKCIICRRILGLPYKQPENPPLEQYRTKSHRPFAMCGLDYIGPFFIHTNDKNEQVDKSSDAESEGKSKGPKAWIVLFSCLVSRAIFMVLVPDRGVETFLRAFRILSVQHCEPQFLISDNEKSFEAADKILQIISQKPKIKNMFGVKNIIWKFLPSRASWMGGVYERLIKIIKIELKKLQGKSKFTVMEWRSHLADVEHFINNRPLTYVSDDPLEPEVVTPNAILHGCMNDTVIATDINIDEAIADMKRFQSNPETMYREKIKLKHQFWNKIRDEYTATLNTANFKKNQSKGKYSYKDPEVGAVVAIQDSETKLGGRLGIILRLIPSSDNIVRKAEVKTTIPSPHVNIYKNLRTVNRIKAINHLIPLELKVDTHTPISEEDVISLNRTQTSENFDLLDDLDEPDACCGVPHCIKPVNNIKWVECTNSNCKTWCHYDCVGIPNSKEFEQDEEYLCPCCSGNNFEGFSNQNSDSEHLETFTPVASTSGQTSEPGHTFRLKRKAKDSAANNVRNLVSTGQL